MRLCLFNFNVSAVMEASAGKDLWVPLALSTIRSRIVASTISDHPLLCLAKS